MPKVKQPVNDHNMSILFWYLVPLVNVVSHAWSSCFVFLYQNCFPVDVEDHLQEVYEEVLPLDTQWKNFGGALRLNHATLKFIGSCPGDTRDHLKKVFVNIWLEIITV